MGPGLYGRPQTAPSPLPPCEVTGRRRLAATWKRALTRPQAGRHSGLSSSLRDWEKFVSAAHKPASLWCFCSGSPSGLRHRIRRAPHFVLCHPTEIPRRHSVHCNHLIYFFTLVCRQSDAGALRAGTSPFLVPSVFPWPSGLTKGATASDNPNKGHRGRRTVGILGRGLHSTRVTIWLEMGGRETAHVPSLGVF